MRPGVCMSLLLVCLATSNVLAIRHDWTQAEIDCASAIGVSLGTPTSPSDPGLLRQLTWLSEVVVTARVAEVQHHIRGVYPTIVKLDVVTTHKGSVPPTIFLDLRSGPIYSEYYDRMLIQKVVGEPSFEKGEQVLLFLQTDYMVVDPDQPRQYALDPDHYTPVADYKWIVQGGRVRLAGGSQSYSTVSALNHLQVAVDAENSCQ